MGNEARDGREARSAWYSIQYSSGRRGEKAYCCRESAVGVAPAGLVPANGFDPGVGPRRMAMDIVLEYVEEAG